MKVVIQQYQKSRTLGDMVESMGWHLRAYPDEPTVFACFLRPGEAFMWHLIVKLVKRTCPHRFYLNLYLTRPGFVFVQYVPIVKPK